MKVFTIIAFAGLVASAAALPYGDDKKYDEKAVEHYKDDHKVDYKEDHKVDYKEAHKDDYKKDDYKKDDYKEDDYKKEDDKKEDDKKDDYKKDDYKKEDDKKDDDKKDDYKKDDYKKDDYKKDDYKKDDYKKDDHKDDWSKDEKTKHESLSAFPFDFTSTYYAKATPDTIVNNSQVAVPGQPGASGHFSFGINAAEEVICYNITLQGVEGPYQSPARTATHIHEAPAGRAGPPRLAFDNPTGDGYTRTSFGCLKAPFTTGVNGTDGADTGTGFSLYEIEKNPAGFFADTHTRAFPAGAVRGQLEKKH